MTNSKIFPVEFQIRYSSYPDAIQLDRYPFPQYLVHRSYDYSPNNSAVEPSTDYIIRTVYTNY